MDATREIYWNVGLGVVLPMYVFTALSFLLCALGFIRRIRVYRKGRPLPRMDHPVDRLFSTLKNTFGQLRVIRVRTPGVTHAFLFWGTLLLFIGTLLIMVQVDFTKPLFDVVILRGTFYKIYSLTLDVAGIIAIFMLFGFAARRFLYRPKGLKSGIDDYAIHFLLGVILVTGFLIEGARMAATEMRTNLALAAYSPIGRLVAISMAGMDVEGLRAIHRTLWWTHFFLVMGLIGILPFTKLRHMFTAAAGTLFGDLRAKGAITTLNMEAEGVNNFGAGEVAEFPWKDLFDADACMSCKRCQDRCPAWATGKPLSPMRIVQQIGEAAFSNPPMDLIGMVTPEVLWECTTCRACQEICPAEVEHVNKIIEMRRHLVMMRGEFSGPEVMTAVTNLEVNFNPFGSPFATRGDWADGLPVVRLGDGAAADILYFVGCFASFDKRNQAVARSFIRICDAAGLRVAILEKAERCCGDPLRKLGNEYLYQIVALENIAHIKSSGITNIVTTCPHCFNTLDTDYRDLGFDLEVEHYTVFLERLLREGKLPLSSLGFIATYHDSCYLSRYHDIMREPRALLHSAGAELREMRKSKCETFCCGGGGGLVLAEEKLGSRISVTRARMAQATGAPLMVSSCPFCLTLFEDGIKTGELEDRLQVRDLAEILVERIANA